MKKPPEGTPHFFSPHVTHARRFFLNLRPARGTGLAVVCGGIEQCAPDYRVRRESFPYYSIEYVAQGGGELKLGGRRHELRPGLIFSYGPGIPHHITADAGKPPLKYFVDFAGGQSSRWLRSCHLPPGGVSQILPPTEIQPLFDELIRNGQRATRHTPALCRSLLESLGMKLIEARAPAKGADSAAFATYQKCREHIRSQFRRLRTLDEVSGDCHVDTAYICRLFRRYDHQTPYQLLMRLKMNAAAEHLAQPGALVKNVAAELGFANPFHFSRAFKTVFALPPNAFRQMRQLR